MDAIILCGGKGTRLSEETVSKPKPMVEIGGKPILWHIMKIYSHFGVNRFILALGYKGNQIKKYFYNYKITNADFSLKDIPRYCFSISSIRDQFRIPGTWTLLSGHWCSELIPH